MLEREDISEINSLSRTFPRATHDKSGTICDLRKVRLGKILLVTVPVLETEKLLSF